MADNEGIFATPEAKLTEAFEFTPGEKELFDLLLQGKPDEVVAHELRITEAAVRSRLRSIMRKLNARNRSELLERARQWDLAISRLLN